MLEILGDNLKAKTLECIERDVAKITSAMQLLKMQAVLCGLRWRSVREVCWLQKHIGEPCVKFPDFRMNELTSF